MSRKVEKHQEFMPQQGTINCAKFSLSGKFIALGGQDKKVGIWKLGCPSVVAQLLGHKTEVSSVGFSVDERFVVSGSCGGSIKVWDLQTEQIVKSYSTGHKVGVTCTDYHPTEHVFCSGSADTTIKLWDVRQKEHTQMHKGHSKKVNCVKFSPDGKWIVSGGADGMVKLWDVAAAKQIEDFKQHSAEISCIHFHPVDYILAVGSQDRTVSLWDLDRFQVVERTPAESRPIRALTFTPNGDYFCTATSENFKLWSTDPTAAQDSLEIHWQNIEDMFVDKSSGELYSLSYIESFVTVHNVHMNQLAPANRNANASPIKEHSKSHPPSEKSSPLTPQSMNGGFSTLPEKRNEGRQGYSASPKSDDRGNHRHVSNGPMPRSSMHIEKQHGMGPKQRSRNSAGNEIDDLSTMNDSKVFETEGDPVDSLVREHSQIRRVLASRLTFLKQLGELWIRDRKACLSLALVNVKDNTGGCVDFIRKVMKGYQREVNLDVAIGLLHISTLIMHTNVDSYLVTSLQCIIWLWRAFRSLLYNTLSAPQPVDDLAAEERRERCLIARNLFLSARKILVEERLERIPDESIQDLSYCILREIPEGN